jgi:6-phosphogluconolactonase
MPPSLRVYASPQALALAAASLFVKSAKEAIAERGRFVVALAGGSTPRRTYELLSGSDLSSRVEWGAVHLFLGDERHVHLDDVKSNYRMVQESLLDAVPIPKANVHPVQTQLPPGEAAAAYEVEVRSVLGHEAKFDLIYLGLGADGHTASLFPGTSVLFERDHMVVEVYVAALDAWRVTLTFPAINAARLVVFLVSGVGKREMLRKVIAGEPYPAALVKPETGQLVWLVDGEAATR